MTITPDSALDSLKRHDVNAWLVVGDELARLRRIEEQLETLHEALTVIAERRVPTTFGGGLGAVVNYARKTLAQAASNPAMTPHAGDDSSPLPTEET